MSSASITTSYALWLADFLEAEYGVPASLLFKVAALPAGALECLEGGIGKAGHRRLLTAALELSADPGLGLRLGMARHFTTLGRLGDALVCCTTLRQAIALGLRLQRYTGRFSGRSLLLDCFEHGALGAFQLTAAGDLGELRLLATEEVLGNLLVHSRQVLGERLPIQRLQLAYPRPAHGARYAEIFDVAIEFNAPHTRLWFDAAVLDRPLPQASMRAARLYAAECERNLTAAEDDLLHRVRALIAAEPATPPALPVIAQKLAISPRTLRRHLQARGWSFQKLLDSERGTLAQRYLLDSDMTIAGVAERLGYSDVSSFNRAFRRWAGLPPGRYRREA